MLEIFRELRGLLHVSHVHIDSWVFRLHYSVTTTCMFAFSLIVSAKQYVGNPIDCIHTKDIPEVIIQGLGQNNTRVYLIFCAMDNGFFRDIKKSNFRQDRLFPFLPTLAFSPI